MALIDDLRTKYQGYTDDEILGALQATQYPEYTVDEVSKAIGYEPRKRSLMAVANDTVIEAANATAGAVGSAANFISPGNRVSQFIDEKIVRPGEASQSDVAQQSRRQFQQEVENADGIGDELMAVGRKVLRDPLLTAAQAAGSFAIPGAAVKAAGGIAGAAGAGAAGVARAGLAGGAVAGGALAGGDAAGAAYDLVIKAGGSEEEAIAAARQASAIPAAVGGLGGVVGAERLLAGAGGVKGGIMARALKTGGIEGAQEGFEEGITQYEGQRAAMPFDSAIDPWKGTFAAAGMGAVMGAGIGGVTGALTADPAEAQQRLADAPDVGSMVKAANDLAMAPLGPVVPPVPAVRPRAAGADTMSEIRLLDPADQQEAIGLLAASNNQNAPGNVRRYAQNRLDELLLPFRQVPVGEVTEELPTGEATELQATDAAEQQARTNIAKWMTTAKPVDEARASALVAKAAELGKGDFAVIPHTAGGFTVVPKAWMTPGLADRLMAEQRAAQWPDGRIPAPEAAELIPTGETIEGEARKPRKIPTGEAVELDPELVELEGPESAGRTPRSRVDAVDIDPNGPNAVAQYVERQRRINTPAARAFVQDFSAGRITPADVMGLLAPSRRADPTPDERIAAAAAQAPTIQPGDLLTSDGMPYGTKSAASVRATREGGGNVIEVPGGYVVRKESPREPVLPANARMADRPADAGGDQPGGSGGTVGRVADDGRTGSVRAGLPEAQAGGNADSPAGPGNRPDPALTPGARVNFDGKTWTVIDASPSMIRLDDGQGTRRAISSTSAKWKQVTQAEPSQPVEAGPGTADAQAVAQPAGAAISTDALKQNAGPTNNDAQSTTSTTRSQAPATAAATQTPAGAAPAAGGAVEADGLNPRLPKENRETAQRVESAAEPWQMGATEFGKQSNGNPHWTQSYRGKDDGAYLADVQATHRKLVQDAISAGKDVPAEVLADYPDLKRSTPNATAPVEAASTSGAAAPGPVAPDDDPFAALFGTIAEQEAAQARFMADQAARNEGAAQAAEQQRADATRIRGAITAEKKRATNERDEWAAKVYKKNANQVDLPGDGPSSRESMSIGAINEGKRRNAVEALTQEIGALDKLERGIATDEGAAQFIKSMRDLMAKAERAVESGNWSGQTADAMFQSMLLDDLKMRGPGGKGNVTSNGLSRAVLGAIKPAEGRQPFEHAGLKVYPTKIRSGGQAVDRWAVQLPENKGTDKVLGDTLHETVEAAKKSAEYEARRAEDIAKRDQVAADEEAKRAAKVEANRGKTLRERAIESTLDKQVRNPETGAVTTRREWVQARVAEGLEPKIEAEDKIKPLSRSAFNRATSEEQRAHDARVKAAGKVDAYYLGNFGVTKTEHDYALSLMEARRKPAEPEAAPQDAAERRPTPQAAPNPPDATGRGTPTPPGPAAEPKPKRPPKSFRKTHMVTTAVFVEEAGKFEQREVDADTALKALDEDIAEMTAFRKCVTGG